VIETADLTSDDSAFKVSLDAFEGPLDLLLHLISRHELDVLDVPISSITNQYVEFLRLADEFDIELASEFLVMAATLIDIKASALLPRDEEDDEPEEEFLSPEDSRRELIAALLEYKTFKNIAAEFEQRLELEERFYTRGEVRQEVFSIDNNLLENVSADELARTAFDCFSDAAKRTLTFTHMKSVKYSVEDKIMVIRRQMTDSKRASFRSLVKACETKMEKIVVFLALLEMTKEGIVELRQAVTFGDIEVIRAEEWDRGAIGSWTS